MKPWVGAWESLLGLPSGLPEWVIAALAIIAAYVIVIIPAAAAMTFLERKMVADFQARVGPNRAGPAGIFQPVADLLKLLQKSGGKRVSAGEAVWFAVHAMALYSTVAVLPLSSKLVLVDTDLSAFLPFWAALVLALGTMLLGLNQASAPGWIGGIRVAAQTLSGAFPALIALLCAGIRSGGFSWTAIVGSQGASPLSWTAFSSPFQFIAFAVFLVAGLVLLAIPPLDAGISLPDIHGGVASHLSGRQLSLFRLGRFYGFLLWSILAVTLFLGGWRVPAALGAFSESGDWGWLPPVAETAALLLKTFALMLAITWIARVNPRIRADQVTDLSWKVLSPFSLFALMGSALWAGWSVLR